jgi:hypothetical protein
VADIDEVAAGMARAPLQSKLSNEQTATGVVYSSAGMGIHGLGYVQARTLFGVPCPVIEVLHDRR